MNVPLLFEESPWHLEYLILGAAILTGAILSLVRRYRWNREKLFHIHNGRWAFFLILLLILYSLCFSVAEGVILLWPYLAEIRETIVLFIWMDVSKSVLARDAVIEVGEGKEKTTRMVSRFTLEKREVENLLPHLLGNKVFLGVFGDEAYPLVPLRLLTKETMVSFRTELGNITEKMVSRAEHGTNIGRALIITANHIPPEFTKEGSEACVLHVVAVLTDGEPVGNKADLSSDLEDGSGRLRRIPCLSVKLVGIGNPEKPSRIPVLDHLGIPTGEYDTDEKGLIPTRPNFQFLGEIAHRLSGEFLDGRSGVELKSSLKDILSKEKRVIGYKPETAEILLVRYLAGAILALLLLLNPIRNPLG